MANTIIQHPLENGQQVALVRNTASGFEQGIAALTGLCTAGPLGAIAAWGALRGLQGKWMPWALIGIPTAPILVGVQLAVGAAMIAPTAIPLIQEQAPLQEQSRTYQQPAPLQEQSRTYQQPARTIPAVNMETSNVGLAPRNTCWFEMRSGSTEGSQCSVSSRVNANGHNVIDVVEPSGLKRSIVLWSNGDAEVFFKSKRYLGTHQEIGSRVAITLAGGTFQFVSP